MSDPLVSVILPFLNGGPEFGPALRSILQQSYSNWELLLCDDGSTDGSLECARSVSDPRVVVWSDGKTKGLASRLNECIARSRGSLIARMDADDISYPQRLREQVMYLQNHPEVDLVGCRMLIFGEDGTPLGQRPVPVEHAQIVRNPALGFGLAHPTWMARASWYQKHRYDPNALRFEDAEILQRAYRTSHFANLPQLLYGYRELRGGFQKRCKTRLGRVRYLRQTSGGGLFVRAALAEVVRVALDATLAATGTRYVMMRRREEALETDQIRQWQKLFAGLATTGPSISIDRLEGAAV